MKKFIALIFSFLTVCSTASALDEQDSGKTLPARVCDRPVISLPENPTTGYSWRFFITPEDQQLVSDIKETYIAPDQQKVGTGGFKEYTFTIQKKGKITVTGYYIRPWENPDHEKDRKVVYTFDVQN